MHLTDLFAVRFGIIALLILQLCFSSSFFFYSKIFFGDDSPLLGGAFLGICDPLP